jgi:hypothetical protein
MMKKVRNIGLMIGLIILISSSSKAQYYYTSYGYTLDWNIPQYIHHTIYDSYYGYEIAHVDRYTNHGYTNFNVLLHRNGWFVELRFDGHGHIYKTIHHRNNYPLMAHTCSTHCGYHKTYYATYYPKYHHGHHHKTVYVNTNNSYGSHQHNNYYTNVYVEKQHNNSRANQEKVIRKSHQSNNRNIEKQRSDSDRRVQATNEAGRTSASKSGRGRSR